MQVHQLQYFVEVAKELHFGKAAANLHVSPSAISRAVKDLESFLKRPLFIRGYHTLQMTSDGLELLLRAEDVLDRLIDIEEHFTRAPTLSGTWA